MTSERPFDTQVSVAIIIPVRNGREEIAQCLMPIVAQLGERDRLIVVDDASSDGTAEAAERLGAEVIRRDLCGGPYAARNDGWTATEEPYVVFTDVRCVARSHWLERLRYACREGGDLVFSDVIVRNGPRLAERVAAQRQHLLARLYVDNAYFLPYYPTANLAVRRAALEAVDGFRVMPSGGDADFCWRVQLAGFTHINAIREPLMEWRPRTTVRALLEQWQKYGRSNAALRFAFADAGAPIDEAPPSWRLVLRHARRIAGRVRRDADLPTFVNGLTDLVYDLAYANAVRRLKESSEHG